MAPPCDIPCRFKKRDAGVMSSVKKKAMTMYTTMVRRAQSPRMRATLRSTSAITTTTATTMVPSGIPRRSALPESLDRHVSGASAAMGPAWQL